MADISTLQGVVPSVPVGVNYSGPDQYIPESVEVGGFKANVIGPLGAIWFTSISPSIKKSESFKVGRIQAPLGLRSLLGVSKAGKTLTGGLKGAVGGGLGAFFYTGNPFIGIGGAFLGSQGGLGKWSTVRNSPMFQWFTEKGSNLGPSRFPWESTIKGADFNDSVIKRLRDIGASSARPMGSVQRELSEHILNAAKVRSQLPTAAEVVKKTAGKHAGYVKLSNSKLLSKYMNFDVELGKYKSSFEMVYGKVGNLASKPLVRGDVRGYEGIVRGLRQTPEFRRMAKEYGLPRDITSKFMKGLGAQIMAEEGVELLGKQGFEYGLGQYYSASSRFVRRTKPLESLGITKTAIKAHAKAEGITYSKAVRSLTENYLTKHTSSMTSQTLKSAAGMMGIATEGVPLSTVQSQVVKGFMARQELLGGMTKMAKVASKFYIGSLAASALFYTARGGVSLIRNLSTTLDKMTRLDFGGKVIQSQQASTERERALQALNNSSLNARQFIGQEAMLLHT